MREAIDSRQSHTCRLLNYRRDGTPFWNFLHLAPIRAPDGSVRRYVGTQVDVTSATDGKHAVEDRDAAGVTLFVRHDARLQAQFGGAAAEVEAVVGGPGEGSPPADAVAPAPAVPNAAPRCGLDFATTMERIQQSFVIADPSLPDCPIVYAADGFLQLTGYPREEVLGRNCRFLQGPDTDRKTVAAVRAAIDAGSEITVRLLNYTKTGRPFWNLVTMAPLRDASGAVRFFVGVQIDVTDTPRKGQRTQDSLLSKQLASGVIRSAAAIAPPKAAMNSPWAAICDPDMIFCKRHAYGRDVADAIASARAELAKAGKQLGREDFGVLKQVGGGDVGKVYVVEVIPGDDRPQGERPKLAMKVMDKAEMVRRNKVHRVRTEDAILREIDHPFLPTLHYCFQTRTHLHYVTDYCMGGDLYKIAGRLPYKRRFSEAAARFYTAEVLVALQYLHLLGIIFRDLKPENILVRGNGHVVLTDFDLSFVGATTPEHISSKELASSDSPEAAALTFACASMTSRTLPISIMGSPGVLVAEPRHKTNSFVGTEDYLPPEIINAAGHSASADWWGLGVLLYELLFGAAPFHGLHRDRTFANVLHCDQKYPEEAASSPAAQALIDKLLEKDPEKRLGERGGAAEIMRDPFYRSLDFALLHWQQAPFDARTGSWQAGFEPPARPADLSPLRSPSRSGLSGSAPSPMQAQAGPAR